MKFYLAVLTALWLAPPIFAQDCTQSVSGEIIDFHDKTPLSGALVVVVNQDLQVTTDDKGKFTIKGLCASTIELEISHPECTSQFLKVDIHDKKELKISLEHHLELLEEVQVVGAAQKQKTPSSIEKTVQLGTIERMSGGSLGDVLKTVSGVSSLNTGANIVKPVIQGLNGSRVLILNNEVRMQDMEWGAEHAPNIDINAANRITLVKGAGALQYGGDAIGGVILITPEKMAAKDSLYGKILANGVTNGRGGNATLELTKSFENGWFVKAQGSYKRLGDLEAPAYVLSNTGISQVGGSLQIGKNNFKEGWEAYYSYFDTDIAILRASHIGNVDDLITAINSKQPSFISPFGYTIDNPSQEVTHHLIKGNYYKRFEGLGKLKIQYDYQQNQRFEYDLRRGDARGIPSIDLTLRTHTFSSDFKIDADSEKQLMFGVMGRWQNNEADPSTGVRRLIPDYDKYDLGAFATLEYHVSNQLILDGGLRYDFSRIDAKKFYQRSRWEERGYDQDFAALVIEDFGTQLLTNPVLDFHNVSGTLGGKYKLGNETDIRVNYALSQRAPNASEVFSEGLHHSAARIELGDLRIKSEISHKVAVALEKKSVKWGYSLAPYANRINDFILLEPSGVEFTIRGAFPVWAYRQTDALLLGVDANIYSQWFSKWRSEHQLSFIKGRDETLGNALINVPPVRLQNSLIYQNPTLKGLRVAIESNYVFRQNEFPPNITVFSPEDNSSIVLDINTPPPAYHLLNLDVETAFKLQKNTLTLGVNISNLLDTEYRDYLNRLRLFADDIGRNISLRLKYIF